MAAPAPPPAEEAPVTYKVARKEAPYLYTPLPAQEACIRLVELYPRSSPDAGIHCDLRAVHFDETCPPYETLSYVWGDESIRAKIRCGGRLMDITETLHVVLERLLPTVEKVGKNEEESDKDEEVSGEGRPKSDEYESGSHADRSPALPGSRLLWIDQLCINQHDKVEKMRQVLMMRDIYRRSTRTVAWLGTSTRHTDEALDSLDRICVTSLSGSLENNDTWNTLAKGGADTYKALLVKGKPVDWGGAQASAGTLSAIGVLLKRHWFGRMWIIQEACVSQQVVLTCGQKEMDLDILLYSVMIALVSRVRKGAAPIGGMQALMTLARFRSAYSREYPLSLSLLLRETWMFDAGDPRDKLYALYGLTSTDLDAVGLLPDYSLPAEQVYSESAVSLIRSAKNLNLLELAGNQWEAVAELPSWVPSFHGARSESWSLTSRDEDSPRLWTRKMMRAVLLRWAVSQGIGIDDVGEAKFEEIVDNVVSDYDQSPPVIPVRVPQYAASKKTELVSADLEPGGVLRLRGHIVDKVRQASCVVPSPIPEQGELQLMLQDAGSFGQEVRTTAGWMKALLAGIRDYGKAVVERERMVFDRGADAPYPTGEPLATAYRRTLCASHTALAEDEAERAFNEWCDGLKGVRFINDLRDWTHARYTTGLGTVMAFGVSRSMGSGEANLFAHLAQVSNERRLAWTHRGFLALLPPEACEGDVIAVLQGGRVPFVLRSKGGPWQMIGPCYVHGIMDGEAFDEESCGDVRLV